MSSTTDDEQNAQSDAALDYLGGAVARLELDGVKARPIIDALAGLLSVMLAAAPAELVGRVETSLFAIVQRRRCATWEAIEATLKG